IARTTASRSALTKFSITVSSGGFAAASFAAGLAPRAGVCATMGAGNASAQMTAHAIGFIIASSTGDDFSPALGTARKSFISGSEVQNRGLAVAPSQQRYQPGELRLDCRVGSGQRSRDTLKA